LIASGFAWLNELMTWLGRWVPRIRLIRCGQDGVLFSPGGRVQRKPPGVVMFWPIVQDLEIVSTRERTMEISGQAIGKGPFETRMISMIVTFRVIDAVRALVSLQGITSNIDDRAQAHLTRAAMNITAAHTALRVEFAPHGIDIISLDVHCDAWALIVKNALDYSPSHQATEER